MHKKVLLAGVLLAMIALVAAACTTGQRELLQTAAAPNNYVSNPLPTETPFFSRLVSPTPLPTVGGMMGTWTAVAQMIVMPTIDTEPYVIVNQGKPHFIEFHALW